MEVNYVKGEKEEFENIIKDIDILYKQDVL